LMRILFGVGLGLINTRAVTMIGERFTGARMNRLQGIRCSMETLGQAALTFLAGQLLAFRWNLAFAAYGAAFVILFMYLAFVPVKKSGRESAFREGGERHRITSVEWKVIILHMLMGGMMVSSNVSVSLRMAAHVVGKGIGTSVSASNVLSIAIMGGFAGGLLFGKFVNRFGRIVLPVFACVSAAGMAVIGFSDSLWAVAAGAVAANFGVTNCVSFVFSSITQKMHPQSLNTANTFVLVGCHLGGALTPMILQIVGKVNSSIEAGFFAYACFLFVTAAAVFVKFAGKK